MNDQPPPLNVRIANDLRRRILSGDLRPGDQLPTRAQIEQEERVSSAVVRRVFDRLVSEGLAERRTGVGLFVRERLPMGVLVRSWRPSMIGGSPFTEDLERSGRSGSWDYDSETIQAPALVRARLGLDEPDGPMPDVMRTRYVFRTGGYLCTSSEVYRLTKGTPIAFPEDGPHAGASLFERMAVVGITVTHRSERVSARPLLSDEATELEVPTGALALTIARITYAGDLAVETADVVVPVDRYELLYGISAAEMAGE